MPLKYASGWFVLPVGLCEWKITNIHPIPTPVFKNNLITFDAEILKIFNPKFRRRLTHSIKDTKKAQGV